MSLAGIAFPETTENTRQTTPGTGGWVHHPVYSHPVSAFEYFACSDPHRYDMEEYEKDSPDERLVKLYEKDEAEKILDRIASRPREGNERFSYRKAGY